MTLSIVEPRLNLPQLPGGWNTQKILAFVHHELGGVIGDQSRYFTFISECLVVCLSVCLSLCTSLSLFLPLSLSLSHTHTHTHTFFLFLFLSLFLVFVHNRFERVTGHKSKYFTSVCVCVLSLYLSLSLFLSVFFSRSPFLCLSLFGICIS